MGTVRRLLLILLIVFLAAPAVRGGEPRESLLLFDQYLDLARDQRWPQIKLRRSIVRALGESGDSVAPSLLLVVFRKDKQQACRVPAMLAVGHRGTPKQVRALVDMAIRDRNDVYAMLIPDALALREGPAAAKIGAWLAEERLTAKNRTIRAALIRAVGLLRAPAAKEMLEKTLAEGKDGVRVLYEALLALARIDGAVAVPHVKPYLKHRKPFLRGAAVAALGITADPDVPGIVLPLAADPDPRVREAVAEFIRVRRALPHLPILVDLLSDPRLRVVAKARDVLEEVTGEKFGFDPGAWTAWLAKKQKKPPIRLPDSVGSVSSFYGMSILTDRVLFLVDASGSMNAGRPRRIEIARKELGQALEKLSKKAIFNVVGFGGSPVWWSDRERPATPKALEQAKKFAAGLSVGGETNLYDTLVSALERNREADTIFLLGDGCPSAGKVVEHDEILVRIRWMNRMRKVRINCVALVRAPGNPGGAPPVTPSRRDEDEFEAAELLHRLAIENDGTFLRRYN